MDSSPLPFRRTPAMLAVLAVLIDGREHYGLEVANTTGRATGGVVPILSRLEQHGWVTARWEDDTGPLRGPRRRFYQLRPDHMPRARAVLAGKGMLDIGIKEESA